MNSNVSRTLTYQKIIINLLGNFILLMGLATVACGANLMRWSRSVVPYWDEWDFVLAYNQFHYFPVRWIWDQHNEHRLILAKLIFVVDMLYLQGRNWPMYVGIFLCPVVLSVLIGYMLGQLDGVRGSLWSACLGIGLYCVFCPSQWENFYWAFQVSFMAVSIWVLIAILSLLIQKQRLDARQTVSRRLIAISLVAALFATFTNGNGITVWPVLIVLAIMSAIPWRLTMIYAAGFATSMALYLVGYQSPSVHARPLDSIHQPLLVLQYVEKYLGSPLLLSGHYDWAPQIGEAALILCLFLLWRLLSRRFDATLLDYAFAGILLYCMATAFVTALGRLVFGTDQAFAPRYQTFALLFWFALTAWIMSIMSRKGATKSLLLLYLCVAAILCSSIRGYRPILEEVKDRIMQREVAGAAIVTGVHDDNYLKTTVYPRPELIWPRVEYLKQRHLFLFSTRTAREIGRNLSPDYRIFPAGACIGYVDLITKIDAQSNGSRLEGWAVDQRTKRPLRTLLFVAGDTVVGYAVSGKGRIDVVNAIGSRRAFRSGWIGYAANAMSNGQLDVYGVLDSSGGVCHLGTAKIP